MEFDITFVELTPDLVMVSSLTKKGKAFIDAYPAGTVYSGNRYIERATVPDIYGQAKEKNLRVARTNNKGNREAI